MFRFDPIAAQPLAIDLSRVTPNGGVLTASLCLRGQPMTMRSLKMGAKIVSDGATLLDVTYPPLGAELVHVAAQGDIHNPSWRVIWSGRAHWRPDDPLEVSAYVETAQRGRIDVTASAVAPRPPQPYADWVWSEVTRAWDAPLPYPEGGGVYDWQGGAWVAVAV